MAAVAALEGRPITQGILSDYKADSNFRAHVKQALSGNKAAISALVQAWCVPVGAGPSVPAVSITALWPAESQPVCAEKWEPAGEGLQARYTTEEFAWAMIAQWGSRETLARLKAKFRIPQVWDSVANEYLPAVFEKPYLAADGEWHVLGLDLERLEWCGDMEPN